jgi:hypothetical protein
MPIEASSNAVGCLGYLATIECSTVQLQADAWGHIVTEQIDEAKREWQTLHVQFLWPMEGTSSRWTSNGSENSGFRFAAPVRSSRGLETLQQIARSRGHTTGGAWVHETKLRANIAAPNVPHTHLDSTRIIGWRACERGSG